MTIIMTLISVKHHYIIYNLSMPYYNAQGTQGAHQNYNLFMFINVFVFYELTFCICILLAVIIQGVIPCCLTKCNRQAVCVFCRSTSTNTNGEAMLYLSEYIIQGNLCDTFYSLELQLNLDSLVNLTNTDGRIYFLSFCQILYCDRDITCNWQICTLSSIFFIA